MKAGYYKASNYNGGAWFYGVLIDINPDTVLLSPTEFLNRLSNLADDEIITTYMGIEHEPIFKQIERDYDIDY